MLYVSYIAVGRQWGVYYIYQLPKEEHNIVPFDVCNYIKFSLGILKTSTNSHGRTNNLINLSTLFELLQLFVTFKISQTYTYIIYFTWRCKSYFYQPLIVQ